MSLHIIGDTKKFRVKTSYGSTMMATKIKGRSVKGNFRSVTFVKVVMPTAEDTAGVNATAVQCFDNKKHWAHDLIATQRAYKKCRYFK